MEEINTIRKGKANSIIDEIDLSFLDAIYQLTFTYTEIGLENVRVILKISPRSFIFHKERLLKLGLIKETKNHRFKYLVLTEEGINLLKILK